MSHDRVHEQPPVAGQQGAIFGNHDLEQATITGVSLVSGVQSEQPQIARELAEMAIGNEAVPDAHLQSRSCGQHFRRRGDAVDFQSHRRLHLPGKIHRARNAILVRGDDQIHFGMRHATGLNDILDGRLLTERTANGR